ncbi:unnamed protein product [Rhizophagus irregularis]|nr:unnamed protein product [Rhizophagus irregularis]
MQDTNISQYEVNITPTVPQRLNRRVFNRLVEQYRERALGGARPVFDGSAIVFTHKPLPFETRSFDVELEEDNAPVGRARIPRRFTIRIRKTREIFMGDLFRFLNGRGDMTNNCQMAMVAMDIIISHKISAIYPTVRRSFYTPQVTKPLPGGLEAWQGRNQYFPIEVCDVIREQRYMRKLTGMQTDEMMNFARQNPNVRANKIQDGLNILNYRDNEYLQQFGMSISNNMAVDSPHSNNSVPPNIKGETYRTERNLPDNIIEGFLREFVVTCIDTGMNIPNRRPPICRENPIGNTEESLKKAWLRAGNNAKVQPQLILCADVSHPPPGETDKPSYAALCGSMDARASRYAASIRVQTGRYEIIVDMANMVKELLKTFYQTCGRKPERILFYRDGISEGQFENVLRSEFNAIRAACQALDAKQNTDRSGNCLPGTVVDKNITHPFEFDFYLLSHAGLLGTSRPAHYHVLYDENGFDANRLQTLSYNLCYIFVRCTRAVSLVPPVYYAHLVTTRAKHHTHKVPGGDHTFGVVKPDLQRAIYGSLGRLQVRFLSGNCPVIW